MIDRGKIRSLFLRHDRPHRAGRSARRRPRPRHRPRARGLGLLQVGAWMEVTGLRTVRAEARSIARAHPREGFELLFPAALLKSIGSVSACTGLLVP